jgi:hypothetical protein
MAEMHHHMATPIAVEGAFTHRAQHRESANVLGDWTGWACSGKEY